MDGLTSRRGGAPADHALVAELYAASAFAALAEAHAPKTPIVQAGAVPPLLSLVRNGSPEVVYLAAKAVLYCR